MHDPPNFGSLVHHRFSCPTIHIQSRSSLVHNLFDIE